MLVSLVVSCSKSSGSSDNGSKDLNSQLNAANSFPTIYEFDDFLPHDQNMLHATTFENDYMSISVVDPTPATHDLGQKSQNWVTRYTSGKITISFKKDISDLNLVSMKQNISTELPVGVINSIFTPKKADGSSEVSCFSGSYKAGQVCTIGLIYKGIDFTENKQQDKIEFAFVSNQFKTPLIAEMSLRNDHKSNNQNIGIVKVRDPDELNVVQLPSIYRNGAIVQDNSLSLFFQNAGDGVIGKDADNKLAKVSVGISNPANNLKDIKYYQGQDGNPFKCKTNQFGEVNPVSFCQLLGVLPSNGDSKIDPYYLNLVLNYNAQSSSSTSPIKITTMFPMVVSYGEFEPQNYKLNSVMDVMRPHDVRLLNVTGNNLAYTPLVSDVKFYLTTNLAIFVPYMVKNKTVIYDVNSKFNTELLSRISLNNKLDNIDFSNNSYNLYFGNAVSVAKQAYSGGLLIAKYRDQENNLVTQMIGSVIFNSENSLPPVTDTKKDQTDGFCSGNIYDYNPNFEQDGDWFYFSREQCKSSQGLTPGNSDMFAAYNTRVKFPAGNYFSMPDNPLDDVTPEKFRAALYGYSSDVKYYNAIDLMSKYPYMKLYYNHGTYVSGIVFKLRSHSMDYMCLLHMETKDNMQSNKKYWTSGEEIEAHFDCWDSKQQMVVTNAV